MSKSIVNVEYILNGETFKKLIRIDAKHMRNYKRGLRTLGQTLCVIGDALKYELVTEYGYDVTNLEIEDFEEMSVERDVLVKYYIFDNQGKLLRTDCEIVITLDNTCLNDLMVFSKAIPCIKLVHGEDACNILIQSWVAM